VNILLLHNHYQQPGGEDRVFVNEAQLLEAAGHRVTRYSLHNDAVASLGRARLAAATLWNRRVHGELRRLIRRDAIDLCHFHNTFPLASPAVYWAARSEGAATVQTLHNYRLLCPAATLYREGRPCEDCAGRFFALPAVAHACYRQDRLATFATAAMLSLHRTLGTWSKAVDVYIALTPFAREAFVAAGLPAGKTVVKPNMHPVRGGPGGGNGGYVVFAGRLSPEKGVGTLLEAWARYRPPFRLKIAGDGPLGARVAVAAASVPNIEWLGQVEREKLDTVIAEAALLVFPSEWYESGPLTVIEALARGTPVVTSALGGMPWLVKDGVTGLHFQPGDAAGLARRIEWAHAHPAELRAMRPAARRDYENRFAPEKNLALLTDIYRQARNCARERTGTVCAKSHAVRSRS
jgi:glycosyltransferase involved in cell wall biosynthesis